MNEIYNIRFHADGGMSFEVNFNIELNGEGSMKNYEKYQKLVIKSIVEGNPCYLAEKAYGKKGCERRLCSDCRKRIGEWLKEEYMLRIDWSKVPVDTPILLTYPPRNGEYRHFEKFYDGKIWTFDDGKTSWTTKGQHTGWKENEAELAREEDIEKYSM